MIKAVLVDENLESLNKEISILKEIEEVHFLGSFLSFDELKNSKLSFNLIIFNVELNSKEQILNEIKEIKKLNENTGFIAISREINTDLIKDLKNEGIEDFILKPILPNILSANIKKLSSLKKDKKGKSIAVFSSKEGSGSTCAAINLAYLIALKTSKKTLFLDFDFSSNQCFFGIKEKTNFLDFLNKFENFDNFSLVQNFKQFKDSSLYVCSFDDMECVSISDIIKILNACKNAFDYVIVDLEKGFSEKNISILNNIELVLLFSVLNIQEIVNLQKNNELFNKIGYSKDKVKIIINRYLKNQDDLISKVEKIIEKEVFATISNNYLTLIDSINQEKPLEITNPNSNIAKDYKNLAKKILNTDFSKLSKENSSLYDHGIYNLLNRMGE